MTYCHAATFVMSSLARSLVFGGQLDSFTWYVVSAWAALRTPTLISRTPAMRTCLQLSVMLSIDILTRYSWFHTSLFALALGSSSRRHYYRLRPHSTTTECASSAAPVRLHGTTTECASSMPVVKKPAAAISRAHRSHLRDVEAESACKRPRGPKRKRLTSVSPRQVRRRKALERRYAGRVHVVATEGLTA